MPMGPETRLLGSSGSGVTSAGELRMRDAFAGFINPDMAPVRPCLRCCAGGGAVLWAARSETSPAIARCLSE